MKKLILSIFASLLFYAELPAQALISSDAITNTSAKINWSYNLEPGQNIYCGVACSSSELAAFTTASGKAPAIYHKYMAWGASYNAFDPNMMTNIRNSGSIPMITWEPWNYKTTDATYTLANIINGNFDAYITQWALAAKAWGQPFFLRFGHEMNGKTWYPWQEGMNGNKTGEYVKAYRHIFNIFKSVSAFNVNWVWNPNVSFYGSTPLAGLYPGDEYVHWVGLNGYNRSSSTSTWKTFSTVYNASLKELETIAPSKKIMIGEISTSENGGSKADWITDAYVNQIPANKNIKAVCWFNNQATYDYRIQSSATATSAFKTAIANPYYLSNTFSKVGASSYNIRYRINTESNWKTVSSANYSAVLSGLKPGTKYEYQVQAVLLAGGLSAFSASKYFTTVADPSNNNTTTTGINDNSAEAIGYSIYPNPFNNAVNINLTTEYDAQLQIKIIDIKGALVYATNEFKTNEKFTVGDHLSQGLYFLLLETPFESKTIKIVKTQ